MPRYAHADDSDIFRAVVTETTKKPGQPDRVFTQTFGPYAERRPASAQITREKSAARKSNDRERISAARMGIEPRFEYVVTGHVEVAHPEWKTVEA